MERDRGARIHGGSGSRRAPNRFLLGLLLFQGLSGIAGGIGLTVDPSGRAIGLDLLWLEGSPFQDYLLPGLVLLIVLGLGPVLVAAAWLRRAPWAWMGSLLVGMALMGWIGVQVLVVGYMSWPPLQLIYGLVGLAIVLTTLSRATRTPFAARG